MEQLGSRLMMAGDLATAEKGESAGEEEQAEVAMAKDRSAGVARATAEDLENLDESTAQGIEIDDATVAELAEMSVDILFGTEVLNDTAEDQMEQTMADLISDVAKGMSGAFDGTDEFLSLDTLIKSIDMGDVNEVAAALASGLDSNLAVGIANVGPGSDWLLPTGKTASTVTGIAGDTSAFAGLANLNHAKGAGPIGTAAAVVDVGVRVGNDIDDGTARLGTGTAIVFATTAIIVGATVGGPAGAAIGAAVGLVGWLIGKYADGGDAAVEAKNEAASTKVDTTAAAEATETKADATDDGKSATTPSEGPTFEEQLRFLQYLLATSPAFRQTMNWIQQSKAQGDIDPPRHQQDLGDTTMSDTSGQDGFVNPGTPTGTVGTGTPNVPPAQGGDIDFGPEVVQSFDANHRPGTSDVPSDVGRSSGTVASPTTNNQITNNARKGA